MYLYIYTYFGLTISQGFWIESCGHEVSLLDPSDALFCRLSNKYQYTLCLSLILKAWTTRVWNDKTVWLQALGILMIGILMMGSTWSKYVGPCLVDRIYSLWSKIYYDGLCQYGLCPYTGSVQCSSSFDVQHGITWISMIMKW